VTTSGTDAQADLDRRSQQSVGQNLQEMIPYGLQAVTMGIPAGEPMMLSAGSARALPSPRPQTLAELLEQNPARLQRGETMGGPENWYHGTGDANYSEFNPALAGKSAGYALNKQPATWATSEPVVASEFAFNAVNRGSGASRSRRL
jgi:hypothetical protein